MVSILDSKCIWESIKPGDKYFPLTSITNVSGPIKSLQSPTNTIYSPLMAISPIYISLVITFITSPPYSTTSAN